MTTQGSSLCRKLSAAAFALALTSASLTACSSDAGNSVSDSAGALKGGVPNSDHGKGKANAMSQAHAGAAANAPGLSGDDAGVTHEPKGMATGNGNGAMSAAGAAAAAPGKSADKGMGKAKSSKGASKMGVDEGDDDDMDETDESDQDDQDDQDDMNDEADEGPDSDTESDEDAVTDEADESTP